MEGAKKVLVSLALPAHTQIMNSSRISGEEAAYAMSRDIRKFKKGKGRGVGGKTASTKKLGRGAGKTTRQKERKLSGASAMAMASAASADSPELTRGRSLTQQEQDLQKEIQEVKKEEATVSDGSHTFH